VAFIPQILNQIGFKFPAFELFSLQGRGTFVKSVEL